MRRLRRLTPLFPAILLLVLFCCFFGVTRGLNGRTMETLESLKSELEAVKTALEVEQAKNRQQTRSGGSRDDGEEQRYLVLQQRAIERFSGKPVKSGDITVVEWIRDIRGQIASRGIPAGKQAAFILDCLKGQARREILGRGDSVCKDPEQIFKVLTKVFGDGVSLAELQQKFFTYTQSDEEDVVSCSLELVGLYEQMVQLDQSFTSCRETNLKGRLAEAVKEEGLRRELRRLNAESPSLSFFEARDRALDWFGKAPKLEGSKPKGGHASVEVQQVNVHSRLEDLVKEQADQIKAQNEQIQQLLTVLKSGVAKPSNYGPRRCYTCGSKDHIRRNCPQEQDNFKKSNPQGGSIEGELQLN